MSAEADLKLSVFSTSARQTIAIGETFGRQLEAGDIVGLTGELGAGKTVLTKGIAAGLGFRESDMVTSPTYKILNRYEGRVTINHFDAYRLDGPGDFADAGGEDLLSGGSVCVIEWAEQIAEALPANTIRIYISVLTESDREFLFDLPVCRAHLQAVLAEMTGQGGNP